MSRAFLPPLPAWESIPVEESESALVLRHQWYIEAATAENTRRAYRSAIRHFERWGGPSPTETRTVSAYLLAHAENPQSPDFIPAVNGTASLAPTSGFPRPYRCPRSA